MTEDIWEDDAFDAELQSMFADVAPPAEDPVFVDHVVQKLAKPERTRLIALGGAGASGSAVAGTQLENLIERAPVEEMNGIFGQAMSFVGPEALVTIVLALVALSFAWVLPGARNMI